MSEDEGAIRKLVDDWMEASKTGDAAKALSLMADDVVFMVPGREPFGKEAFKTALKGMKEMVLEAQPRFARSRFWAAGRGAALSSS